MNKQVDKINFKAKVLHNKTLALVQFKKKWNGASQIIEPVYEELSKTYRGIVDFYTIDVEIEAALEKEYGIVDIPTILFFKSGAIVDHAIGLTPKNILISKIENAIIATSN